MSRTLWGEVTDLFEDTSAELENGADTHRENNLVILARALVASLALPDTRERGYPEGTQAPET
jgi:hypothetical protein